MTKRKHKSLELDLKYYSQLIIPFIVMLVASYIMWKEWMVKYYSSHIPNIILVFIYILAITTSYTFLIGMFEKTFVRIFDKDEPIKLGRIFYRAIIGGLIIAIIAACLELIYEIDITKNHVTPSKQIVYCIDDSGSMNDSDEDCIRLSAVRQIIKNKNNNARVGLVRFSAQVNSSTKIDYLYNNKSILLKKISKKESAGNTNIGEALINCINQIEKTKNYKNNSILLLTDGVTEPFSEKSVINKCKRLGIRIDAVSLGDSTDLEFLTRITNKTGGKVSEVTGAEFIEPAYTILSGRNINRCLFLPVVIKSQRTFLNKIMQV